jgi:hypothetical protein
MKTLILAAFVALGLTATLAPVANAGVAQATRMQQTGSYSH